MIVIGGGVIGVATLSALCAKGVPAVLLEANDDLALETSFANGGMMTPSQPEPWNSPSAFAHLLSSLFQPNSAMRIHWRVLPGIMGWGLRFLQNSVPAAARKSAEANFVLAGYSLNCAKNLTQQYQLQYDQGCNGSLKVFSSKYEFAKSINMAQELQDLGLRFDAMDGAGAVTVEPQLQHARKQIAGAIYYPDDCMGDARKFTLALAEHAKASGGQIKLQSKVTGLIRENNRIIGVDTASGPIFGEVVVCAGISAPDLLRPLDLPLPIKPVKGYSITVDASALSGQMPMLPVVDEARHIAITPIAKRLRVVGMAEFAGVDHELPAKRLHLLRGVFDTIYPHLSSHLDWQAASPWTGLRPMNCDGVPIIGRSPVNGLWLNCGHGHLGWTMAAGSAALLADMIIGARPAIDCSAYAYNR